MYRATESAYGSAQPAPPPTSGGYDPWRQQSAPQPSRSPAPARPYDNAAYYEQPLSSSRHQPSAYPPAGSGRSHGAALSPNDPIGHRSGSPASRALSPARTPRDEKETSAATLPTLSDAYAAAEKRGMMPSEQKRSSIALVRSGQLNKKAGLRMWRNEEHAGTFTRGGRGKTCLRCFCCTVLLAILLIIGIVAGFLLWVRAPNVIFNGVDPPSDGQQVTGLQNGFLLNFLLDINVLNPNFFGARFPQVAATAYYPISGNPVIGGGEMDDIEIKSHSNTTIKFPFAINYTTAIDPNGAILTDLASKCGFLGSAKTNLRVNYSLMLKLKILVLNISPTFSSSASFACPLQQSDVSALLNAKGIIQGTATSVTNTLKTSKRTTVLEEREEHEALGRISRSLTDAMLAAVPYHWT